MPIQIHSLRFGINRCYIIQDNGIIMIDGGPPKKLKAFQKLIKQLDINPSEIRLLVLTHGDFDHVTGSPMADILTITRIIAKARETRRANCRGSRTIRYKQQGAPCCAPRLPSLVHLDAVMR